MRKVLAITVLLVGFACSVADAQAFGGRRGCRGGCNDCCTDCCNSGCGACGDCGAGCGGCTVSYVEQTVTQYQAQWKERDVQVTVYKPVQREVKVQCKVITWEPRTREEKRTCVTYKSVPTEVEQTVTRCRMVAVCQPACGGCGSGCGGCGGCGSGCGGAHVCYRPEYYTEKVRCTVYRCVAETKEVTVQVQYCAAVEKTVESTRLVCEMVAEKQTRKERYCECVPVQVKVKVPVYSYTGCGDCGSCGSGCGGCGDCGGYANCGGCGRRGRCR